MVRNCISYKATFSLRIVIDLHYLLTQYPRLAGEGLGGIRFGEKELPQFVEQSLVPIVVILGSSFLVAILSRQFLRVVTEWRRSREETRAERIRKIQTLSHNWCKGEASTAFCLLS